MNAAELLIELKSLCHHDRIRRMIELGRDAANEPLLAELEQGESFARRLVLYSCFTSRDGERVLRLSRDESRRIRFAAARMAPLCCNDEQLAAIFLQAPKGVRRRMLLGLRNRGRFAEVDQLCLLVSEHDANWLEYAYYASQPVVEAAWKEDTHWYQKGEWRQLAKFYPELACHELVKLVTLPILVFHLREIANDVIRVAAERAPEAAMQVARVFLSGPLKGDLVVGPLLPYYPDEIAQLILATNGQKGVDFSAVGHKLRTETLVALIQARPDLIGRKDTLFRKITPEQRLELFERFQFGWFDHYHPRDLLRLLPSAVRHREVRHKIRTSEAASNPEDLMKYAAMLPWDELRKIADVYLHDPYYQYRAAALSALVQAVRFDKSRLVEVLELLVERGNEQQAVNGRAYQRLANLPVTVWRVEHLPLLEKIVQHVVARSDAASEAIHHLQFLFLKLSRLDADWAGKQFARLSAYAGSVSLWGVDKNVRESDMAVFGSHLIPVLRDWKQRENPELLRSLQVFGGPLKIKRLQDWPTATEFLVELITNGTAALAQEALSLLGKYRRDVLAELVPQLLRLDESWGTNPVVYNFVHRYRQDLLSPVMLGRKIPEGRLWDGDKVPFVLPLSTGFERWNPEQQAAFALTLDETLSEPNLELPKIKQVVNQWFTLPDIDAASLLKYAAADNPRAVVQDAVLKRLGRLDRSQGLPVLLEAMNDERARIAIYALRKNILELPVEVATDSLSKISLSKVTIAKEVLRLLGELRYDRALELVLEIGSRELHRDVRVALLRALWDHLDDERAWSALLEAAHDKDAALARMAGRTRPRKLTPSGHKQYVKLLSVLMQHPEVVVRIEAITSAIGIAARDEEGVLVPYLLHCGHSHHRGERSRALNALISEYSVVSPDVFREVLHLAAMDKRLFASVIDMSVGQVRFRKEVMGSLGRILLEELARDPMTISWLMAVSLQILPEAEFVDVLTAETRAGRLHLGVLMKLRDTLRSEYYRLPQLPTLEIRLAESEFSEFRWLAFCALTAQAQDGLGWTDERVERLKIYRQDAAPLVAESALGHYVARVDDLEAVA